MLIRKKRKVHCGLVNKKQLAVAIIVGGAFWVVFLGIYPIGFLIRPSPQLLPLNVTYSGLDERYEVGDALKFSIKYEGAWYSNQDYSIRIKQVDNPKGDLLDKTIWMSKEMLHISEGPPEQPVGIEYVIKVGKDPANTIILREAGLYAVSSEGGNVPNGERYFRVIES